MIPIVVAALMGTAMATTPAPAPTPTPDACAQACIDKWLACKKAPDANMAGCAPAFAGCVGYNPYTGGDVFVTPVACSTNGPSVVTQTTLQTITSCVDHKCTNPTPTPDACLATCNAKWDACKTAKGANMASCSAEYSQCVGYAPFENGVFGTATACKTGPASVPTNAPTPTPDACLATCNAKWDACKTAKGANMASCSADYSKCVGYAPFENGVFGTATACKTGPASVPTNAPTPAPNSCLATCNAKWDACKTAKGANMASCSADYSKCVGYAPFENGVFGTATACKTATATVPTNAPVVTAAAGHLEPAVILAALGVAALL